MKMNPLANLTLIIILLMMVAVGCESDESSNPVAPADYQIALISPLDSLDWLAGRELYLPVRALVLDQNGSVAPDVKVTLALVAGQGYFLDASCTSDHLGRVETTAMLMPSAGRQQFSLLLSVPGGSTVQNVAVDGFPEPKRITFDAPQTTFKVVSGQSVETTFTTIFSDSSGLGLAGLPVRTGLLSDNGSGDIFGSVSSPATTDGNGEVEIRFSSAGDFGTVRVFVQSAIAGMESPLDSSLMISVQKLTDDIGSFTIYATPNYHTVPIDSSAMSQIRVVVKNQVNVAIPNLAVRLTTSFGSLSHITATDENGVATAQWQSNFEFGDAEIVASIPGTEYSDIAIIKVQNLTPVSGYLSISTDINTIYADGGLTVARIRALLKDSDNQALTDRRLIFTSTHGAISSPIRTNGLGYVDTIFTDVGLPSLDWSGNIIPAKIYVKYPPLNLIDSVEITIAPRNPVDHITLSSTKNQMTAGSGDSATIKATLILANNDYAPPGTLVHFEVENANGYCTPWAVPVTQFGVAETRYIAGNFIGTAVIRAYVINDDGSIVYSSEVEIILLPGPPNQIRLSATPNSLDANDPVRYSTITAVVTDTSGNPVSQGVLVQFTTTLGSITPAAIIGEAGSVRVRLYPNGQVGEADVKAWVTLPGGTTIEGHCYVTFIGGVTNSIRVIAEPSVIQAAETGGISNSTIQAGLFDGSGASITYSEMVYFELPDEPDLPDGCSWPNRSRIDSVRTANGIAIKSLNAGLRNGPVFIKVYAFRDFFRTDTVKALGYFVTVEGGIEQVPPGMSLEYNPDGDDVGGGTWQIPIRALLIDEDGYPWHNRTPVGFTVLPEDAAVINPGFTGNDIGFGSERGVAQTWLYYHSVKSYDSITVRAEVQIQGGVMAQEMSLRLPLQDATLELNVDPQNWQFDRNNPEDTCRVRVWAIVQDGHQIGGFDGVPVRFTTEHGWFVMEDGHRIMDVTVPTEDGVATVYLYITLRNIEDPWWGGYDDVVTLNASIPEYDVEADPNFLFVTVR